MNCYVNHPTSGATLPAHLTLENTLFYPESKMSIYECYTSARPKDFHIMTNSPEFVGLYSRNEVFMWDREKQKWVNPDEQTYGADIHIIRHMCFGITTSIPRAVLDGKVTNCMGHPLTPSRKP